MEITPKFWLLFGAYKGLSYSAFARITGLASPLLHL